MTDVTTTDAPDASVELSNAIDDIVCNAGIAVNDAMFALAMSIGVVAAHPALAATPSEELAENVRRTVLRYIDEARHYNRIAERTPS
jgi:hypothetical protein